MSPRRRGLFLVSAAAVAFGIVVVVIVTGTSRLRSEAVFVGRFERIDALIEDGDLAEAAAILSDLEDAARTREQWLSILRRRRQVSTAGDEGLASSALAALDRLPGSQEIAAVAAYALIRTGDFERAAEVAEVLESEAYETIRVWAYLVAGRTDELSGLKNPLAIVATLQDSRDVEEFRLAAEQTGDHRLAVNAALLAAADGAFRSAVSLLPPASSPHLPSILALRLYREAGLVDEALDLLGAPVSPEEHAIAADLSVIAGRFGAAARHLEAVVDAAPGAYPEAYVNLALLRPGRTEEILAAGLQRNPDSAAIVVALARYLGEDGRVTEALELIEDAQVADPAVELAALDLGQPAVDLLPARLRQILRRYPPERHAASAAAARRLMAHEYLRNSGALEELLEDYPDDPAAQTYRGLLAYRRQAYQEAAAHFADAWNLGPSRYTATNRVLSAIAVGELEEARDAVDVAARFYPDGTSSLDIVDLRLRLALSDGNVEEAARLFADAEARASGDPRTSEMRRLLEAAVSR